MRFHPRRSLSALQVGQGPPNCITPVCRAPLTLLGSKISLRARKLPQGSTVARLPMRMDSVSILMGNLVAPPRSSGTVWSSTSGMVSEY